jgi:lysophospholipase L1-like esterase
MPLISPNSVILFQGDSITDCDRDIDTLGDGYAAMTAGALDALYPDYQLKLFNRGISGNRVRDLRDRWQEDCLDLAPDIVTILVGINDTWHWFTGGDRVSEAAFEEDYRYIVEKTRGTGAALVLLEPFLLPVEDSQEEWRHDLGAKIQIIRRLAREYQTEYIPLDGLFAKASAAQPMDSLAFDGVHPTPEGHRLIARVLLEALTQNRLTDN